MNFFRTFLAALLAFFVANIVLFVFTMMFFVGLAAAFGEGEVRVKPGSVLKISLNERINDSPMPYSINEMDFQEFKIRSANTILDVVNAIEHAATDPNIEGIYITSASQTNMSSENASEMRQALIDFKQSGKFILSYSDVYSQLGYYICSAGDKVYVNPKGSVSWHGLASNVMFYKGLLDKLGVEVEVLRHGSFKAAVEPFILDKMSPENRLQLTTVVNSLWGSLVGEIAASRGIDSLELNKYADDLAIGSAQDAVDKKLVDSLVYFDQMMGVLNKEMGGDQDDDDAPNAVSLPKYIVASKMNFTSVSKNKIAIIYADGQIIDGQSKDGSIGGNTIAEKLQNVRKDDKVKAVVLRVNSPGGSALASEVMWREMELLKKEKPVIVSMGGVAASGGYYISCPADAIISGKLTITGSIGVFGMLYNAEAGLKNKLGITTDVAKSNPSADLGVPFRKITPAERAFIMTSIEEVYSTFIGHVSNGRNMPVERVDAIGGGRIWSGVNAKEIGLVDGHGGLKDAIALAADRAGIADDFRVYEEIEAEDNIAVILKTIAESKINAGLKNELGDAFIHYNNLMTMLNTKGVQARMPYVLDFQ